MGWAAERRGVESRENATRSRRPDTARTSAQVQYFLYLFCSAVLLNSDRSPDIPPTTHKPTEDERGLLFTYYTLVFTTGRRGSFIYIGKTRRKAVSRSWKWNRLSGQLPLPHTVEWHLARCILHRIRACRIRSPQSALYPSHCADCFARATPGRDD